MAAFAEREEVATVLLAHGAKLNTKNSNGDSPLLFAASEGHHGVVELLLSNGADVNAANLVGNTPLHGAAWRGHKAVVEMLLASRANANARNNVGYRPLDLVRGEENADLAELLRQHTTTAAAQLEPTVAPGSRVGELGDPETLSFEGAVAFTREALVGGLMENPEFLLASHSAAPLAEYLEALRRLVMSGYQANGFPEVDVATSFDSQSGRIVVIVAEGPRYLAGKVRMVGAETIPVDALVQRLTEGFPAPRDRISTLRTDVGAGAPNQLQSGSKILDRRGKEVVHTPPAWRKGEPAPFDEASLKVLSAQVAGVLADLGYFFPKTEVKVVPGGDGRTAELLVEILDEGPMGIVENIDVTGNTKDAREQLLQFLRLSPGMAFNRDLVTRTELILWNSARFLDYGVTPERVDGDASKVKVSIRLVEYEPAPALSEDFSAEAKAFLRVRDWLSEAQSRDDDFVIDLTSPLLPRNAGFRLILSNHGAVAIITVADQNGDPLPMQATVLSRDYIGLFSPAHRRKLIHPKPGGQLFANLSLLPDPDAAGESPFALDFGAGFGTKSPEDPSFAIRFDTILAPVAFVSFAHRPDARASIQDGTLTINDGSLYIAADAQSGRLVDFRITFGEESVARLHVQGGVFDRAIRRLEEDSVKHRDLMDSRSPINSWIGYLLEDVLTSEILAPILFEQIASESRSRAAVVLRKIFSTQALLPVDRLAAEIFSDGKENFNIPQEQAETMEAWSKSAYGASLAMVFRYSNEVFPKGSWPWTAAREAVFVLGGKGKYTGAELKRIFESDQTGPVGYLTIAKLLGYIKHPGAQAFAYRGLERLSDADFRKDARLVLEGTSVLAESIERLAVALREFEDEEIEALAAVLPPETSDFLKEGIRLLRDGPSKPVGEVLSPAINDYWNTALRGQVEHWLSEQAAR